MKGKFPRRKRRRRSWKKEAQHGLRRADAAREAAWDKPSLHRPVPPVRTRWPGEHRSAALCSVALMLAAIATIAAVAWKFRQ